MCHYTRRHNSLRIELNPRMNRSKQRQQRQKELCCLCLLLFKFPAVIFDAVYREPGERCKQVKFLGVHDFHESTRIRGNSCNLSQAGSEARLAGVLEFQNRLRTSQVLPHLRPRRSGGRRAQRHFSLGIAHLPLFIGNAKCPMLIAQYSMRWEK